MKRTMVLAAVWFAAASTASAQSSKVIDRTIPLAASGSVVLDTHNGSIDVQTWDRPDIRIRARIEVISPWAGRGLLDQTSVDIRSAWDSVRITSRYPAAERWAWWLDINSQIDYTITAPKAARWTITDHNATVSIRGVHAALTINTHNGRVRLADLDGPLRVNTHNGDVTAELRAFQGAEFTSHNGSLDIALPSTAAFHLHADTRTAVESDFPLAIRSSGRHQRIVDGAVNGDGPGLRFESLHGELRLRRSS